MKTVGKVLSVILGIFIIVCGLYCMFTPDITYLALGYIIGIVMIVDAIIQFVTWSELKQTGAATSWMLVCGILSLVLGFFVLNNSILQLGIDLFIVYYIAVWLVARGIMSFVAAHKIHSGQEALGISLTGKSWVWLIILGILLCLFGILSIINPTVLALTIGVLMGLGVVCCGACIITIATTPAPFEEN